MGKIVKNGVDYTGGSGVSSYNELNDKPQINGVTLSGNKTPDALGLVTKAVNDLVNYYLKTETYSKTEVDTIVTAIKNSRFEVVATLPTSDIKTNVIYLVPKADAKSGDIKDEYINLDGTTAGWEKIGSTDIDLSNYVSEDDLNTALADYTTTTDLTALLANKQDKLQYSTLPTASAELEGKIFEYTGVTGNGLTHGYFYECVSDGESEPTYSWQQTNVQPNSGGTGGGHTIEDAEGTDLTQRDTLQFGEGFKAEDDDTNKKTVISPDVMQSGDMNDVITPLPSVQTKYYKYSTEEQIVGTWIDGSTIYEKTYNVGTITNGSSINIDVSNLNVVINSFGYGRATRNTATEMTGQGWAKIGEKTENLSGNSARSIDVKNPTFSSGKIWFYLTGTDNVDGMTSVFFTIQYTKTTD